MKKYLLFSLLSVVLSTSISYAGMGMSGSVVKKKADGEKIKAVFYGDLILGPDRVMGNARVKAMGQALHPDSNDDIILRTTSPISKITGDAVELDFNGKTKTFLITPKTTFCDHNGERIKRKYFNPETTVTISSRVNEKTASSIRMGPLFFTGVMAGSPKLKDISCGK